MHFWGMTHPDQVRALKPFEYAAMHDHAVKQSGASQPKRRG